MSLWSPDLGRRDDSSSDMLSGICFGCSSLIVLAPHSPQSLSTPSHSSARLSTCPGVITWGGVQNRGRVGMQNSSARPPWKGSHNDSSRKPRRYCSKVPTPGGLEPHDSPGVVRHHVQAEGDRKDKRSRLRRPYRPLHRGGLTHPHPGLPLLGRAGRDAWSSSSPSSSHGGATAPSGPASHRDQRDLPADSATEEKYVQHWEEEWIGGDTSPTTQEDDALERRRRHKQRGAEHTGGARRIGKRRPTSH